MEIISRSQAKLLGKKFYFTGMPCKRGHISKRYATGGSCCKCMTERDLTHEVKATKKEYESTYKCKAVGKKYNATPDRKAAQKLAKSIWYRQKLAKKLQGNIKWKL